MAKKFAKESKERPNDPISKRGLESNLGKLREAQDFYKTISSSDNTANIFWDGGPSFEWSPISFKCLIGLRWQQEKPVSLIPATVVEETLCLHLPYCSKKPVVRPPLISLFLLWEYKIIHRNCQMTNQQMQQLI